MELFSLSAGSFTLERIQLIVLLILVLVFTIHSVIVAYHWITYAQNRPEAFTATMIHIGVGVALLLVMAGITLF